MTASPAEGVYLDRLQALVLCLVGRTAEAAGILDRVLELDADRVVFVERDHTLAGIVALMAGDYLAGARHLERAYEIAAHPVVWDNWGYSALYRDHSTLLGYAYQKTGRGEEALRLFEETEQYYIERIAGGDTTIRARVGIAAVHALRGDRDAAYDWLQKALDAGFFQYADLERHPCFESLHGEERFKKMMAVAKARVDNARARLVAMEATGE